MDTLIEYLLFIGSGLYLVAAIMFLYIFMRTLRTKDGIGLLFLKILSFGIFSGSLVVFTIRVLSEYGNLDYVTARAIATVNPIILVGVGLYLNYLFQSSTHQLTKGDNQNIKDIKADVKESNANVKIIKHDMLKRPGVK